MFKLGCKTVLKFVLVIFILFSAGYILAVNDFSFTCEKSKDQCIIQEKDIFGKVESKEFKISNIKNLSIDRQEEYEKSEKEGLRHASRNKQHRYALNKKQHKSEKPQLNDDSYEIKYKIIFNLKDGSKIDYPNSESSVSTDNSASVDPESYKMADDFAKQSVNEEFNKFNNYLKSKDDKFLEESNVTPIKLILGGLLVIAIFLMFK